MAETTTTTANRGPGGPRRTGGFRPRRGSGPGGRFRRYRRRKVCIFCKDPDILIDYKETDLLRKYISDRGRMFPRRRSGNCAKHQRRVSEEIKRARFVALLPYTTG